MANDPCSSAGVGAGTAACCASRPAGGDGVDVETWHRRHIYGCYAPAIFPTFAIAGYLLRWRRTWFPSGAIAGLRRRCSKRGRELARDEAIHEVGSTRSSPPAIGPGAADVSPMTRAVVLLNFREGRQCKEIARASKLTRRQVRRHLTAPSNGLRQTLRAEVHDECS